MREIPRDEYDALKAINWSKLKLLEKTPLHYLKGNDADSTALRLGTAAHSAVLEPDRFTADYVVYPKRRQGKEWEAFETEAIRNGKQVLSQKEHDEAVAIRDSVWRNPKAMRLLSGGKPEVAVTWSIEGEGFKFECKGRFDYIGEAVVDLKSCRNASPRGFAASCHKYGYYGQAAWYSDGLLRETRQRRPFYFIAVESSAPYVTQVYSVPDHILKFGRDQYAQLLGKLDYCTRNNFWGGYSEQDELELGLPEWSGQQGDDE